MRQIKNQSSEDLFQELIEMLIDYLKLYASNKSKIGNITKKGMRNFRYISVKWI